MHRTLLKLFSKSCCDNLRDLKSVGIVAVAVTFAMCGSVAEAQQADRVYRIGTLENSSPSGRAHLWEAFRQGLRDLGYIEGKNIVLEQRWGEGKRDRLAGLATELIRLKVDIIVTSGTPSTVAAKKATGTIPIVMASQSDPVGSGIVVSLARPGGNVTGLSSMNLELGGKRLELLKQTFPHISRIAFLQGIQSGSPQLKEIEAAARALGLQLQVVETAGGKDFENAFLTIAKQRADAVSVTSSPPYFAERKRLAEVAAKSRLPAMYAESEYVDVGGLMAYGIIPSDLYRRAATYVDKILKGTKPADLPVEQPTKFEFVINLKTAKQIDVTIPPNVLARADKVIR
jgi:putative tryptophan/tyrosine transport system substrate-binding protein